MDVLADLDAALAKAASSVDATPLTLSAVLVALGLAVLVALTKVEKRLEQVNAS